MGSTTLFKPVLINPEQVVRFCACSIVKSDSGLTILYVYFMCKKEGKSRKFAAHAPVYLGKKYSVAIQATAHSLLHKQYIVFNDVLKRKDNKQQK